MPGATRSIVRVQDADDFNTSPASYVSGNVQSVLGNVLAPLGSVRSGGRAVFSILLAAARKINTYEHTVYCDLTTASFDVTLPDVPLEGEEHDFARVDTTASRTLRVLDAKGTVVYTSGSVATQVTISVQWDAMNTVWRLKRKGAL